MSDIELAVKEYVAGLQDRCPKISPCIFPSGCNINCLDHLCTNPQHAAKLYSWLDEKKSIFSNQSFKTSVHFSTREIKVTPLNNIADDAIILYSLERLMKLFIFGSHIETKKVVENFIMENDHKIELEAGHRMLYEAVHLAYSLKVLLSNTPGLRLTLGGHALPLPSNAPIDEIITQLNCEVDASTNELGINKHENYVQPSKNVESTEYTDHQIPEGDCSDQIPMDNFQSKSRIKCRPSKKAIRNTNDLMKKNKRRRGKGLLRSKV